MINRIQEIDTAISRLESFKKDPSYLHYKYAIEQNVSFLNAARTVPSYISWLFKKANKVDVSKLIELTDFPVEEWGRKMHKQLIEVQRNKHVGLGKPLVNKILSYIYSENRNLILANFGAGGMEIDKQIIFQLLEKTSEYLTVIIGIDRSSVTQEIAKENLGSLPGLRIYEVTHLNKDILEKIKKNQKGIMVILCRNDVFKLEKDFPNGYFDLIYDSLFKHHLVLSEQEKLDVVIKNISKNIFEYDGYKTWPVILPQSIMAWEHPLFLSDTILSFLRYKNKKDINISSNKVSFFNKTGHYLLEIKNG